MITRRMTYLAGFIVFISLSSGICLVLVDTWFYKLAKLMNLSLKLQSSTLKPIVKIGLWQLRLQGVFHISLGLVLLAIIVIPSQLPSDLVRGLIIFPIIIWVILPIMMEAYYLKNRKDIKKTWRTIDKDSCTY